MLNNINWEEFKSPSNFSVFHFPFSVFKSDAVRYAPDARDVASLHLRRLPRPNSEFRIPFTRC